MMARVSMGYFKLVPVMFINDKALVFVMAFQQPTDNPIKHRFTDFGKDKLDVAKWKVTVRDAYNMVYIYTMIHDWAMEEDWCSRDDSSFPETYYVNREDHKGRKEIWIRWRLEKHPEGMPKTSLWRYYMDLNWKVIGLAETEIVWKGQKVTADRGEFELECNAYLVIDTKNELSKGAFKWAKDMYYKRVLKRQSAVHWKSIYGDAYRLRDLVMNYLKLETFMPEKEAGEFYLKRTLE